jgi:hypothetical protein
MASTFSDLGIELMATGENAGTWGDKTNTNLQIVEKAIAGYVEQAVTSGGTTALSITDGDTTESTSVARHAVIKLTGTITGNSIVTVPDSIEKVYIVINGTSGAYTVQFKTASGSGITFGTSDKGTRLVFSDGTNIVDTATGGVGSYDLNGDSLILDEDQDTTITADTDDQIDIAIAGADDFRFTANTFTALSGSTIAAQALTATTIVASSTVQGTTITATTAFVPDASDGAALGTSSLEFSDLFLADGAVINFGDDQDVSLTHVADTGLLLSSGDQLQFGDAGENISGDGTDLTINSSGDVIMKLTGEQLIFHDGSSNIGQVDLTSNNLIIKSLVNDKDMIFKGVDGSSEITALTLDMSEAGAATFNSNVTVGGDLTVSGDDITMGTNTAGNLLIADGTNFNSVAVGSLSEISTVANDDVFLAVDTSGGGLKKITRSAVVSGLAASGAISNVVEDTSPQLGGDLDTNSANILIDDAHFIADENGNEQIIFQTTSSAVNQFDVTNAATGNPPQLSATGGDSNIDLNLLAKGTGHVTIVGNSNSGAIQFNCESNSHGQILKAQPHSAGVTNEMLLPDGANSTLVSLVATQTLTNKTLTTPVIAEIDSLSSGDITLDADGDINLDAGGADINFKDDGTKFGHVKQSSSNMYIQVETQDKDIHFRGNDGGSIFNALILDMSEAGAATFNDKITAVGTSVFTNLDISGDIDVDGTANLDVVDIDGAVDMASTLQVDGAITSSSGATITTADNTAQLVLKSTDADANTGPTLQLVRDSGSPADNDLIGSIDFVADDDGGNTFTAFNMFAKATDVSNGSEDAEAKIQVMVGGSQTDRITLNADGTTFTGGINVGNTISAGSSNLTFDVSGDINLDADGGDIFLKDGGTTFGEFTNSSTDFVIKSTTSDKDILIKGNDGGSTITALTLDMSDAGTATFNHDIKIADGGQIGSASDADAMAISSAGVVTFSGAANVGQQALTSSSNAVAWDASAKPNAFHLTTENTTFSAPSNAVEGAFIALEINYNGSHTIAWNTVFEFAASTAPTATSTDGKTDILVFRYNGSVWQEVGMQ